MTVSAHNRTWIFTSKGECLSVIRSLAEDAATACEFDEKTVFAIKVAISEAAANAIEHGSPKGEEDTIQVEISCSVDDMTVRIKDNGSFQRRKATENDQLSTRGRGIYLITALMDSVSIQESSAGTLLSMSKQRMDS